MSKLMNKLAAFLAIGETEQGTFPAITSHKGLDECLLM